jgi:hypothetical protein
MVTDQVNQCHLDAFIPGLNEFKAYINSVSSEPSTFSRTGLCQLIDAFAHILIQHLSEEISTRKSYIKLLLMRAPELRSCLRSQQTEG